MPMADPVGGGSTSPDAVVEQIEALKAEHAALKHRLSDLDQQRFLTPAEQVERRRLQKLKLRAKDRIVALEQALPG